MQSLILSRLGPETNSGLRFNKRKEISDPIITIQHISRWAKCSGRRMAVI